MNYLSLCVNFILACVTMLLLVIFTQIIFKAKFKIKSIILYSLVSGFLCSIFVDVFAYIGVSVKLFSAFISMTVILKYFFNIRWAQSFIAAGLFTILEGFGNAAAFGVFYTFGVDDILAKNDLRILLLAHLIIDSTIIIGLMIIRYFKLFANYPKETRTRAYITNIIYILLILIIMASYMSFYYSLSEYLKGANSAVIIFNTITLLIFFIFSIINTNTIFKLESKSQELDTQIFYNKIMETLIGSLRRFKHNYNNMLNVISGYVDAKDWNEFSIYFKEVIEESKTVNEISSMALLNIKSAGLIGLLTSKQEYAKSKGVDINIIIQGEISELNMRISDLCEVLGIFLDNAIEAAEGSEKRNVNINMIKCFDGSINISIENTLKEKPDVRKIFEKNYSSKGEGRGLGLWITKNILDKYKNVLLNTILENNLFKQEIIINK